MIIKFGVLSTTPEKLQALIDEEWKDRYEMVDGTLKRAYSASNMFAPTQDALEKFTREYVSGVRDKIEDRHRITRDDIDNVRTLERLMLGMRYDTQGEHYKSHVRQLENPATPHLTIWKNLEIKARHAGLLDEADRSGEVRVRATHRYSEIGSNLQ